VIGIVTAVLVLTVSAGCGVMGPPVPPDTIGVGAKRQAEKRQQEQVEKAAKAQAQPPTVPTVPAEQPETADEAVAGETAAEELSRPGLRPSGDVLMRPR